MKLWKTILQNVLSGCVGAVLVISVARAQKTDPAVTQPEIRTHKLFIVDDDGSEIGYLGVNTDGPILRLKSGEYGLQLSVSKKSGSSAFLGSAQSTSVLLNASDLAASMLLSKDGYSIDSKHVIKLAVDATDSDVELVGPKASVSVGHQPQLFLGGIFCRMNNTSGGALTLSDHKNHVYWSKFPPDAK